MPPTDDPLATALAAIRAEGYLGGPVPRLLKAVEAVLEQHKPLDQREVDPCDEHAYFNSARPVTFAEWREEAVACVRCAVTVTRACPACGGARWPCSTIAAIERALTGGTDE